MNLGILSSPVPPAEFSEALLDSSTAMSILSTDVCGCTPEGGDIKLLKNINVETKKRGSFVLFGRSTPYGSSCPSRSSRSLSSGADSAQQPMDAGSVGRCFKNK